MDHAWLEWCVIRTNDAPLDHFVRRFFRRRCSTCGLVEYRYRIVYL